MRANASGRGRRPAASGCSSDAWWVSTEPHPKEAFAEFLDEQRFSANQIQFVNLVIDELTSNGVVEPRRLYESPFTDVSPQGPDALFAAADMDQLLGVVADVRRRADAA